MTRETRSKIGNVLLCVGMTVLLAGTLIPFFNHDWPWGKWVFVVGALCTLVAQIMIPSPSSEVRARRLSHINVWSAVAYCIAAYCPFSHDFSMQRSWVAFLLAGAVLQIYATIMLSKVTGKKNDASKS